MSAIFWVTNKGKLDDLDSAIFWHQGWCIKRGFLKRFIKDDGD